MLLGHDDRRKSLQSGTGVELKKIGCMFALTMKPLT